MTDDISPSPSPDEVVDELLAGVRTEDGIVGWRMFARTSVWGIAVGLALWLGR